MQGGKLFEFREKRNEFLTPRLTNISRGEPKAKLMGAFSLVRFFGASKEMNEQKVLIRFSVSLLWTRKEAVRLYFSQQSVRVFLFFFAAGASSSG